MHRRGEGARGPPRPLNPAETCHSSVLRCLETLGLANVPRQTHPAYARPAAAPPATAQGLGSMLSIRGLGFKQCGPIHDRGLVVHENCWVPEAPWLVAGGGVRLGEREPPVGATTIAPIRMASRQGRRKSVHDPSTSARSIAGFQRPCRDAPMNA